MPDPDLDATRQRLRLSYMDLWIDYFALGGRLDVGELTDYLQGDGPIDRTDHNVIVHALNELFRDRGEDASLAYRSR